jgi:hypothetical protein
MFTSPQFPAPAPMSAFAQLADVQSQFQRRSPHPATQGPYDRTLGERANGIGSKPAIK